MNISDKLSSYGTSTRMNEQLSEKEQDEQEEENNDNKGSSDDIKKENVEG